MTKADLAQLIDAYADAKTSGNEYLIKRVIGDLEAALNSLFPNETIPAPQIVEPQLANPEPEA